jgi:hypothetical protein
VCKINIGFKNEELYADFVIFDASSKPCPQKLRANNQSNFGFFCFEYFSKFFYFEKHASTNLKSAEKSVF